MDQIRRSPEARHVLKIASALSLSVGSVVLLGWLLGVPELARLHPSFVMMKANAAVGFMLLGSAVWALASTDAPGPWRRGLIRSCSIAAGALGAVTLGEYLLRRDLGIDEILIQDIYTPSQTGAAGRMSSATTVCFLLLGSAVPLFLSRIRLRYWLGQLLILGAWFVSLAAVVGYVYGVDLYFRVGRSTSISPHAAVLLVLLSTALLGSYPNEGFMAALTRSGPGGTIFRRQIAPLIILTVLFGGLTLDGEKHGRYSTEAGHLLYGVLLIMTYLVISWRNANFLNRVEEKRDRAACELKESERRREASEEKLTFALDAGRIGVLDWTLSSGEVRLNEMGRKLFGLPEQQPEIEFPELQARVWPEDSLAFQNALSAAIQKRGLCKQDFRVVWPNGAVRWLHGRGQTVCDAEGAPVRFSCVLTDITSRKKEERRVAEVLESITSGFMALDRKWRFTYINPSGERILGKRADELIGNDIREVLPGVRSTAFEANYRRGIEENAPSRFEAYYPPFRAWYEVMVYPAENGISIYFNDVSERKRAEEALKKSEARFRRLFESNILGIFVYDLSEDKITDANEAFLKMVGYSKEDLRGQKLGWLKMTAPEWVDTDEQGVLQLVETGVMAPYEKEVVRQDGSRVRVYAGAANFEDSTEEGIAYFLDVTEKHRSEERIRELLESERGLLRKAERAIQARDEVAAMVSHDLKNPIGAVLLNAELLHRKSASPEEVVRRAENITQIARRMESLVKDILDVAKIESGTFAVELQPEEVSELCREAYKMLAPLAKARNITLDTQFPEDCCPRIAVDRERVVQVLSNLVGNAIKFTPEGGQITVRAERRPGRVLFSIKDTGPGIASEDIHHVFDRFWQAAHARNKGTGLGLAIVKGIVEAHGGEVCADSRPGEGAAFYFTVLLPETLPDRLRPRLRLATQSA